MNETAAVTRASLGKVLPIVAPAPMTLLPARVWSHDQWERIRRGYRARDMDEKWNVFAEGDMVFLHRSWTGRGVFEASFSATADGWRISSAVVESSSERRRMISDEFDRVVLELVLSATVLGESAVSLRGELIRLSASNVRPESSPGVIEHSVLGPRSGP